MIDQETLGAALAYTNKAIEALKDVVHYIGVTTTALSDGATTNPITINGRSVTAVDGDMVFYNGTAYTWNGTAWQETLSIAQIITQIEELQDAIGNLSNLTTEEKSNLVGAINEIVADIPKNLSDLQDDATHRLVTDTEKSTWNGKATTTDITNAINALDVSSVGGAGKYISAISEADGKISATAETMDEVPTQDSSKAVTSGGIKTAINDSVSLKTATGNPITLTDAANANSEELLMTIEPIQDLHGYTKPWPAGGGKNLLPITVDGIKAANTSGTWNGNTYTLNGVTFTINTDTEGNVIGIKVTGTASGDSPSFYLGKNISFANGNYILNGCPANGSVPSYCMIAEWSGGDVKDLGSGISLSVSGNTIDVRIRIQQNYAITSGGITFYPMLRLSIETDATFAPYTNICPISGLTSGVVETTDGTDTNTASITFGQTVYGGSVNFKTGEVTVTHGFIEYDGSVDEEWDTISTQAGNTYRMRISPPSNIKLPPDNSTPISAISNQYLVLAANSVFTQNTGLSVQSNGGYLAVYDVNYNQSDSVSAWKAHLASEPLTVCYELATPTTLTLTPAELELLKGNNTITANGAEISIEYYPDNAIGALAEKVDDKADITYVDTALAKKDNITTVEIPRFITSQAGWRRICKIKPVDLQTAEGMIYVGGFWSNGQPPSATVAVSLMVSAGSLTLLSSAFAGDKRITAMRLINATRAEFWLDAYFPAYSSLPGPFKFKFTGDIAVSDIQDPISITTDSTAATAEVPLNQNVSGTVLTDKSNVIAGLTANTLTGIDISAYDSASNQYTAPTDGYVRMELRNENQYFYLYINNTTLLGGEGHQVTNANDYMCVFVRKGMNIYYTGTVQTAVFYSLT